MLRNSLQPLPMLQPLVGSVKAAAAAVAVGLGFLASLTLTHATGRGALAQHRKALLLAIPSQLPIPQPLSKHVATVFLSLRRICSNVA